MSYLATGTMLPLASLAWKRQEKSSALSERETSAGRTLSVRGCSKSSIFLPVFLKDQKQFKNTEKRENRTGTYKQKKLYCVSSLNPSPGLHFTVHLWRKFSPEVCCLLCTEHSNYVHPIQIPDSIFHPFSKACAVIFYTVTLTVRICTFERMT